MNETAAKSLVKTTFENPYFRERFLIFTKNLFRHFEPKTFVYRGKYIPDAYSSHVKTLERIGKFEDEDNNKIDILTVCLKKPSSLERARTMQRNFIAWYLNGSRGNIAKDAALVAFYTKNSNNWRLSLVKMDYSLAKSKAGKIKAITELTPARRFSFSVGKDENTHTAQKQLLPVLQKDDQPPVLADLEEAFSVEVVTKDFFEKYKTLFLNTKEALDKIVAKDAKIKSDFTEKNIDTVDFAKKLLGQIVFLYFLQKKGWFGVARDEDWGTGPKDFLRRLFEKKLSAYDNFFNDILEPLFYEALAIERPDDFYSKFNCKIPFLNGGLFDPLGNYDWIHTDIRLDDPLFSNSKKTKEGDIGDGILDVFDRYNFTVKEDEPLEREVAVDPEMLGKVFENLLEVKDRKSKGTYYTPREIVHYMCQESLVNYLTTETDGKVKRDNIETLIRLGETAVEHDSRVVAHGEETETYKFKLPRSIRNNATLIDESLEKIKVCDPAVGSGAFLVGMMTEVIRARNTLSSYLPKNDRSIYAFKRHAIQNCLYGVDIDPGAVEIAKLRLWLSLIVDEQDIKKIKPLPNLDYKIMQGNSLLEEYEGIKLFDEGIVSTSPLDNTKQIEQVKEKLSELQREFFKLHSSGELKGSKKQQIELELSKQNDLLKKLTKAKTTKPENDSLFDQFSQAKQKADELKKLHQEFFEAAHKKDKDSIKKEIETLEWDLIGTTLREQDKQSLLPEIERFKKANIKSFFLWKLNFSEVFEKNGGFDVVIANPPYVSSWNMGEGNKQYFLEHFKASTGHFDLYVLFFEKGLQLIKSNGLLTYITSNKYLSQGYGRGIRHLFLAETIVQIVNFDFKVFEATVDSCITMIKKASTKGNKMKILELHDGDIEQFSLEKLLTRSSLIKELDQSIFEKTDDNNFRINLTNTKFNLINKIREDSLAMENLYFVTRSICVHSSRLGHKKDHYIFKEKKADNFKQYIEAKDFDKWRVNSSRFLNYLPKEHHRPNFKELFEVEGLMCKRTISSGLSFILNDKGWYCNDGVTTSVRWIDLQHLENNQLKQYNLSDNSSLVNNSAQVNNKYVLGILNSKLIKWFFYEYYSDRLHFYPEHLRRMPIKVVSQEGQKKIVNIVESILRTADSDDYLANAAKQAKVREYENQIDQLVYKLYDLTPEEIKIVEENTK